MLSNVLQKVIVEFHNGASFTTMNVSVTGHTIWAYCSPIKVSKYIKCVRLLWKKRTSRIVSIMRSESV
jgi:hypothetical protein